MTLALLVLLLPLARAAGDALDIVRTPAAEQARWRITRDLRADGYRPIRQVGPWTVYAGDRSYKPRVWLHSDGWVDVRRAPPYLIGPVRLLSEGAALTRAQMVAALGADARGADVEALQQGNGVGVACLQNVVCAGAGGWFVSARRFRAAEAHLLAVTAPGADALREAVAAEALARRVNDELPRELAAIWSDPAASAQQRRGRILSLYASRTDSPEGSAARAAIRAFILGVVQASDEPFDPADVPPP